MNKGYFITGTDTEIGKTLITTALINMGVKQGYKVAGMKPVASGCKNTEEGLRNEDALKIISEANIDCDYKVINPYSFFPPVSPHFAASEVGIDIEFSLIKENYQSLTKKSDLVFVEGVGGWEAPLKEEVKVSDLAKDLNLPIVLVVGLKLGCINHALLTAEAIRNKGLKIVACIATVVDEEYCFINETIETLEQHLNISVQLVPWLENATPEQAAKHLEKTIKQINENI